MIAIGNFFFKYRNYLFIFLYLALLIPSPLLFSPEIFGPGYFKIPLIAGLLVTVAGQVIRGATIGLAYIIRGGKDKRVYAEQLVTGGMLNHCRNPLYLGNILMLLGIGILDNSLLYISLVIPAFLFIYQAIVLAEENFLRAKFGDEFRRYFEEVNRWMPDLRGIGATFRSMRFSFSRWISKEYNTQFIWLTGIILILLFKYPQLTHYNTGLRDRCLLIMLSCLALLYLWIKYLKKSGRMRK